MTRHAKLATCVMLACGWLTTHRLAAEPQLAEQARLAIERAACFYTRQAATRGGYVYYYSLDLKQRWGEGVATPDQIWVQPPGTPTVGLALLRAYQATGQRAYFEAATAAAEAIVYGQVTTGGWSNAVDFNPRGDHVAQYRNGRGRGKNHSTLDDGITQSALLLLMRVDEAHQFKHQQIHEAVEFGLEQLLNAQYPNGGFPQVWTGPVPEAPITRAKYPAYDWRSEGRVKNYWDMYTLNDNVTGYLADTLIAAHQIYRQSRYESALRRLGDFLLLAQMPDPQPAWAQQYDLEMRPIWARKFEPPAIAGRESQDVLFTLMKITAHTGDVKYLEPIGKALAYLRKSRLADGRLNRYYELESNRPLYMERAGDKYTLTYSDANLPDHYGWKIESRLDDVERDYEQMRRTPQPLDTPPTAAALAPRVQRIVADLDDQGRWVSTFNGELMVGQPKMKPGEQYLGSATFSRNLETLSDYLLAKP